MKDFAKSIYVGNAKDKNGKDLRPGDDVMVKTDDPKLNKGTVVNINGDTVGVQIWHTGGSVWTTPSRLVTKIGNTRTGNSNKAEIIEKKKKEGATLKVDNGQKLEFSDGSTYVKTSFSDDYREAHNYVGNSYSWTQRRGHQELYDPAIPFGGHVRGYVEKSKNGYTGAKTNGPIVIEQKEFATEAEAKKFVENKQTGNKKVGNANTHLTASNSGELWLNFDGTGEMYDPIELGRYDFSGKSEALSVARELEQLKRKAEQKVKDADKFINAIKQWAAGLK